MASTAVHAKFRIRNACTDNHGELHTHLIDLLEEVGGYGELHKVDHDTVEILGVEHVTPERRCPNCQLAGASFVLINNRTFMADGEGGWTNTAAPSHFQCTNCQQPLAPEQRQTLGLPDPSEIA